MKFNELNQVADEYNIGKGKGDWLDMKAAGDYKVRIISEYEVLAKHWNSAKQSTPCVGKEHGCVFCNVDEKKGEKPNKPSAKFLFWVIDRKSGEIKLSEVGWTVVKAIGDLQQNEEYAFETLPDYDITITHSIKGSGQNPSDHSWTVIPARTSKPLTPEEEAEIKELKPVKEIIESIKGKVLKELSDMGIGGDAAFGGSNEVPPVED